MWADTLFQLEHEHLLRLALWGAASVVAGTMAMAWLAWRRERALLLRHFSIQTMAWGAVVLAIALWQSRSIALRDYAGLQQLIGALWLETGLDAGYAGIGLTLVVTGWRLGRHFGVVGAGLGIAVQGVALLLFHLRLVASIGPLR